MFWSNTTVTIDGNTSNLHIFIIKVSQHCITSDKSLMMVSLGSNSGCKMSISAALASLSSILNKDCSECQTLEKPQTSIMILIHTVFIFCS